MLPAFVSHVTLMVEATEKRGKSLMDQVASKPKGVGKLIALYLGFFVTLTFFAGTYGASLLLDDLHRGLEEGVKLFVSAPTELFQIRTNIALTAGGFLALIPILPLVFRRIHGLGQSVPIYSKLFIGGYSLFAIFYALNLMIIPSLNFVHSLVAMFPAGLDLLLIDVAEWRLRSSAFSALIISAPILLAALVIYLRRNSAVADIEPVSS